MKSFFAWLTLLVMAGSILQPQVLAQGRRDDTTTVYTDVLIKRDSTTLMRGTAQYSAVANQITFTVAPAVAPGMIPTIVGAGQGNHLFINADNPASAQNPDFHHQRIKFIRVSPDRSVWTFELGPY